MDTAQMKKEQAQKTMAELGKQMNPMGKAPIEPLKEGFASKVSVSIRKALYKLTHTHATSRPHANRLRVSKLEVAFWDKEAGDLFDDLFHGKEQSASAFARALRNCSKDRVDQLLRIAKQDMPKIKPGEEQRLKSFNLAKEELEFVSEDRKRTREAFKVINKYMEGEADIKDCADRLKKCGPEGIDIIAERYDLSKVPDKRLAELSDKEREAVTKLTKEIGAQKAIHDNARKKSQEREL